MTDRERRLSLLIKVSTLNGKSKIHEYLLPKDRASADKIVRELVQHVGPALMGERPVFVLHDPTTMYNVANVVSVEIDAEAVSDPEIKKTITIGFAEIVRAQRDAESE